MSSWRAFILPYCQTPGTRQLDPRGRPDGPTACPKARTARDSRLLTGRGRPDSPGTDSDRRTRPGALTCPSAPTRLASLALSSHRPGPAPCWPGRRARSRGGSHRNPGPPARQSQPPTRRDPALCGDTGPRDPDSDITHAVNTNPDSEITHAVNTNASQPTRPGAPGCPSSRTTTSQPPLPPPPASQPASSSASSRKLPATPGRAVLREQRL